MANTNAIAAASMTLAGLIRDRYPRTDFGTSLEIKLFQASDFTGGMTGDGFSIFMYRVGINGTVRNMTFRRTPDGRRLRPSLPVDLHYLITPWAQHADQQQRMLGWVMRTLEDIGVLGASHLNHYVSERDIFAPHESVEVICDPLPLGDYLTLWDRLRPKLPPSASYVLRMILIDSEVRVEEPPLVQTRKVVAGPMVETGALE